MQDSDVDNRKAYYALTKTPIETYNNCKVGSQPY